MKKNTKFFLFFVYLTVGCLFPRLVNGKVLPPIPFFEEKNQRSGSLHFCQKGAVDEFYYDSEEKENFYLRVLRFHGKIITIIKHEKGTKKIQGVWVRKSLKDELTTYFTEKEIKRRFPNGPCSILNFYQD